MRSGGQHPWKAVVAHALDELSVVDVDLAPPKAGEVLVRMRATGVCHSDLSIVNGTIPSPFPTVLGHEGAGVVEAVGEGVTYVAPGDHVVHSFVPQCGECYHCVNDEPYLCTVAKPEGMLLDGTSRVKLDGEPIAVMTFLGNMAEYAVVPAICTASIEKDVDFETDFALYLDLYRRGQLDFDRMVTRTYRIDEALQAFEDLERGANARGVIVYE